MQKAVDQPQQKPNNDAKKQDVNANVNTKFTVTPGTANREIKGVTANETRVQMDMEVQAQDNSQPSQQASGTISTVVDMWVAPSVPGYEEFAEFYKRMAKEINWVPPSNIQIDPRTSQSLEEFQKNSANMKGFPLLDVYGRTATGIVRDHRPESGRLEILVLGQHSDKYERRHGKRSRRTFQQEKEAGRCRGSERSE